MMHKLTHIFSGLVNGLRNILFNVRAPEYSRGGCSKERKFLLNKSTVGKYHDGMTYFSQERLSYKLAVYLLMSSGVKAQRELLDITYWTVDIKFIFIAEIYWTAQGNSPTGSWNGESFIQTHTYKSRDEHASAGTQREKKEKSNTLTHVRVKAQCVIYSRADHSILVFKLEKRPSL